MRLGLDGKVAIVTGGSDGIGRATAAQLCAEGARVVVCARGEQALGEAAAGIAGRGGEVAAVVADVTVPGDLERLREETLRRFGAVDILVNNAGTAAGRPFERVSDDDWQADLDLKLFSAIRLCRLVLPDMRARGGGRIVNVTNLSGRHPGARSVPTSVSRAAGMALTKALSKEFAPEGILVNTVCIGLIRSGQHDRRWRERAAGQSRDAFYADLARSAGVPLGRVGEAEEAADVIVFLASAAASYVTGSAVNIDGGTSQAM